MIDQLQQRLRELRECSSFFSANQTRLRALATVCENMRGDTAWDALERRQATKHNIETVDREIAAVERMLQQWLAARPTAEKEPE